MSYENQNPTPDKLLNSNGSIQSFNNDSISDSTELNIQKFKQSNPIPNKFLYPNGTIKDKDGNTIQESTEENLKKYNQSAPIPAKFLHEDGTVDENIGSGGTSLKYKLYAYKMDIMETSIGYTEKENPIVGDVLLLPSVAGVGAITDPTQLKQVFTITEVHEDGTIYAQKDESSSPIHFSRDSGNDYEETVSDVRDLTDVVENGLLISQKGTAFKGLNIDIPTSGGNKLYSWVNGQRVIFTTKENPTVGDDTYNSWTSSSYEGCYLQKVVGNITDVENNTITITSYGTFTRDNTHDITLS